MPPDVNRWSAHRLDPAAVYDAAIQILDLTHPPDADADGDADTAAQRLDKAAGIDVKADLLPHLGDTVVAFCSPSEGLISFGQVFAIEVKNGEQAPSTRSDCSDTGRRQRQAAESRRRRRSARNLRTQPGRLLLHADLRRLQRLASDEPVPATGAGVHPAGKRRGEDWAPDAGVAAALAACRNPPRG